MIEVALDKFAIAGELREISFLLELKKENPYKARAYAIGASAIEGINEEQLRRLIEDRRLTTIRGIGETLAGQIEEIYETGSSELLQRLRDELPPGVIELSQIPGLSIKKIKALHSDLGISSIAGLEAACRSGQVANIRGFGKKTADNILAGIRSYETREQADLIYHALELNGRIMHTLQGTRGLRQLEKAGDLRRWKETITRIDMVASTEDSGALLKRFTSFPPITNVETPGVDEATARLSSGMKVHLLCSPHSKFAVALLLSTGSAEHVRRLQELAQQKGLTLSENGLKKGRQTIPVETEADIYNHLGLPYMPPELRENAGEFERAKSGETFDDLIRVDNIQGVTHCHTDYSDGKDTIEAMASAAETMGFKYITITDHSAAAHYAGGLDVDRLKQQWDEIADVQSRVKIKLLRGTECDILSDGSLDWADEILEQFDIIIASIHSRMKMDEHEMTKRIINCMKKRQFKIWGHALGRLVLRREPFACRVEEILDAIAESRAGIEVNGDPYRLDMEPKWIRLARERGIPFVISVDAHSTAALNYVEFGVHMARRGGLRRSEVLNTLPVDDFRAAVRPS